MKNNIKFLIFLFLLLFFLNSCNIDNKKVALRIDDNVITIMYPIDRQFVSDKIIIRGLSKDMKYIEIQIDLDGWKKVNGVNEWYYNIDTNNLENGQHVVYIRGYDGTSYSKVKAVRINVKN